VTATVSVVTIGQDELAEISSAEDASGDLSYRQARKILAATQSR
jgi:hypothetical protein